MKEARDAPVRRRRRGLTVAAAGTAVLVVLAVARRYVVRDTEPASERARGPVPSSAAGTSRRCHPGRATPRTEPPRRRDAVAALALIRGYPGAIASGPLPRARRRHALDRDAGGAHRGAVGVLASVGVSAARAVARWYAAHPPAGFSSGGAGAVGRSGRRDDVDLRGVRRASRLGSVTASRTSVEVQTTDDAPTGSGSGRPSARCGLRRGHARRTSRTCGRSR